jgi:hypothetical protein
MALMVGDPALRLVETVHTATPELLGGTVEAMIPGELRPRGGRAGEFVALLIA